MSISTFPSCNDKEEVPPDPHFSNLEEEVDYIARKYLEVGLIIGIVDTHQDKLVFTYGEKSIGSEDRPDENTIFDIGSITKTFTATLIADLYLDGKLDDEIVSHYLPTGVTMPTWNSEEVTLIQLATHTSGLPRTPHENGSTFPLPDGFDGINPYAAYETEDVYNYLTNYCILEFEPGTWWNYSNTGYGLLGHIAGLVEGSSYADVLSTRLFQVLDMQNSTLIPTESQLTNFSQGYDQLFIEKPFFLANDIFQGAGFIKSSLNDMFKYLEAQMGLSNTALNEAMQLTHESVMHQGSMGDQGMAWFILDLDDGQQITYSGGDTLGHSCFIGFNKTAKTGAIVLSNYAYHGRQLTMGQEIMKAIIQY